jgi:hypothetical protein
MFAAATCFAAPAGAKPASLAPATMPKAGTIDERFQSYNIEMVEVTGGRFWKPYDSRKVEKVEGGNQPAIVDPSLFEYRSPINLSNARLRKLAAALGPAYVRVSGTWANATYFQNSDDPAPVTPPKGYNGVLTRAQWKGVIDFSKAVNANLVTSFATSMGTRDADGVWTPDEARQWVDYTKSIGGSIAAAEYMNEPNMPEGAATPKGYDAAAYGRDVKIFHAFAKEALPGMVFLGTGAAGEGTLIVPGAMHMLSSADMLTATGPVFDAISYHSYGGVSSRCASFGPKIGTTAEAALSEDWLARSEQTEEFYRALRDRFEPGKPMWNTETAQTACGGDRWASTFLDTFRYLNQLGILAKRGVQVHLHNTLAASDYALLDQKTYEPRPNYWAALVWRKLMGTTVLDAGTSPSASLKVYAHCLRSQPGGVAILAINTSKDQAQSVEVPAASERYTLSAKELESRQVELNGIELKLGADDALPDLKGTNTRSGKITLAPATITFLAVPQAHNASCLQ